MVKPRNALTNMPRALSEVILDLVELTAYNNHHTRGLVTATQAREA